MHPRILKLALLTVLVTLIALGFINRDSLNIDMLEQHIAQAGALAPLLFMLAYIISTVLFLPGSLLTLLGGVLFGPVMGTVYSLSAATLGAMLAFLIARYLASDWVAQKSSGKLQQLIKGVEAEGWRFVAFTRLVPLFPFNLLNYALGLTRISFSQYSIATCIFMLPGAVAYTYLGYAGKELATGGDDVVQKILLAIALLATVMFIPRIVNQFRRAHMLDITELKSMLDNQQDMLLLDVRTEKDYLGEQGHIKQSILIPLEELPDSILAIDEFREKPIVTICRTDRRSAQAAKLLTKLGFTNVKVARMGMTDWHQHHYPVEH